MKYIERPSRGRPTGVGVRPVEACQIPPKGESSEPLEAWAYEHGIRVHAIDAMSGGFVFIGPKDDSTLAPFGGPLCWAVMPECGHVSVIGPRNFDAMFQPAGA